ncbi:MAG TPA: serine hydrolase [Myxococcota bacterium]|jgi:hypothetical protein
MRHALAISLWILAAHTAHAYPIDGYEATGIARLEAYRLVQEGTVQGRKLPKGALLPSAGIRLLLVDRPDFEIPPADPALSAKLRGLLGGDAPRYGVVLLDLSDPAHPRYAEHNPDVAQNPGSVGKLMVALAWFQALADRHPDDLDARRRLLRETPIVADAFIQSDHHTVPFWKPGETRVVQRKIALGDRANLWTYLDWMASSSSNAAASMAQKHLLLQRGLGERYPVSEAEATAYLAQTPKAELGKLFADAIQTPVTRNGLDLEHLRQGSFFSHVGKQRVPGTSSTATPRELLRYLVKLEQGKLVDLFSSLEIKKLLYLTDRRIRYASSPALEGAAVYFKSGSLYSCQPEPGFACGKYKGNVRNYMNSTAIVEVSERTPPLHYIAVVLSNVLRRNSAVEHQTLGTRIHRLVESLHPLEAAPAPAPVTTPLERSADPAPR